MRGRWMSIAVHSVSSDIDLMDIKDSQALDELSDAGDMTDRSDNQTIASFKGKFKDHLKNLDKTRQSISNKMLQYVPGTKLGAERAMEELRLRELESRIGDWQLDPQYKRKNTLMLLNGMFGLFLALVELQISWRNTKGSLGDIQKTMAVLVETTETTILKFVILGFTVILLLQLIDRHKLIIMEKKKIYGTRDFGFLSDSSTWYFLLEAIILSIHPIPYMEGIIHQTASCLMFMRLYLIGNVLRDYSMLYQKRKEITEICFANSPAPQYGWFFTIQILFHSSPGKFILILANCAISIYTLILYEFEREFQPKKFTLKNTLWYTFTTITTLGFGDYIVISGRGKIITGMIILTGMIIDTLIVVAILENIALSIKDRSALVYLSTIKARDRMEKRAGQFIAHWIWWRQAVKNSGNLYDVDCRRTSLIKVMEKMRHARNKKILIEQSAKDPVLSKLQSLDMGIMKLWRKMKGNKNNKTGDQIMPMPPLFANEIEQDQDQTTGSESKINLITRQTLKLQTDFDTLLSNQTLIYEQNKEILQLLQSKE